MSRLNEIVSRLPIRPDKNHILSVYEEILPPYQESVKSILEIGVQFGGSLLLWAEYFHNAKIYGIDIDLKNNTIPMYCPGYDKSRIQWEEGSQADPEFLESIAKKWGPFDIVVDDGNHVDKDQVTSLKTLCRYTNKLYIIEDVCYYQSSPGMAELMHNWMKTWRDPKGDRLRFRDYINKVYNRDKEAVYEYLNNIESFQLYYSMLVMRMIYGAA